MMTTARLISVHDSDDNDAPYISEDFSSDRCVTNSSVYKRVTQKPRGRWLECQPGPIPSEIRAMVNSGCTGPLRGS